MARHLRRAINHVTAFARKVIQDPDLAVDAPWNDVAHRSGFVPRLVRQRRP